MTTTAGVGGQVSPFGAFTRQVGTTFTAVASANIDYKFRRWLLNGAVSPVTSTTFNFTQGQANGSYTLKAEFEDNTPDPDPDPDPGPPGYWTINVYANVGGTITPSPGEYEIAETDSLPLSVDSIDAGYRFTYWRKDDAYYSAARTIPNFTATAGEQITMRAMFQKVEPSPDPTPVGSDAIGVRSSQLFEQIQHALENEKPLEFDDFVKAFKRGKF